MTNQAAWITASKARPLTVDSADEATPGRGELVIRNYAVSVNPVDWKIQDSGKFIKKYPNILGTDVAGEIVEVGEGVTRFSTGQRVLAHCIGLATGEPKHQGFQRFTVVKDILTSEIPKALSFDRAVVLPLAVSTAAAGLYQKSHLGLPYPSKSAEKDGKTLLVWGGSSSVGATCIQLASASGLTVATTVSSKHNDFVKALGATHVFDYTKSSTVEDIVSTLKGCDFAGVYDAISLEDTIKKSAQVTSQLGGGKIACVLPPPEKGLPENVQAVGVFALSVAMDQTEVGEAVWQNYLPGALADGRLQAKPDPIVIGKGLDRIQEGLDRQKAGVSAGKIVIEL